MTGQRVGGAVVTIASLWLAASGAAAQSGTQDAKYVIGPHDSLRISVWNHADVSGEYTVDRDGTFTFPLIGQVTARGLSPEALEQELRRLLAAGFYRAPQVTVTVVEYRSQRVFVMGALRAPGNYPLTGDVSLIEALAKAGSTTADAADYALIIRSANASGAVFPGQDASAAVTRVDLRQLREGQLPVDLFVRDGDTVFVPRASTLYVSGEVRNPGAYPIEEGTTVRQAISLAGGVSEYGAVNRIRVLRTVNGKERQIKVKLDDLAQRGDTIVVPERFF